MELVQQLVSTAYACADLNAGAVAANPFHLMVKTGAGQRKTRWQTRSVKSKLRKQVKNAGQLDTDGAIEEITDVSHPLLALLAKPTQDPNGIGSYDLRYCTQLYLESVGRAYWWIVRDGLGTPKEIWLLRSHAVREIPDYEQNAIIAGYQYGRQTLSPDDVIKFHNPDPFQLYYGGYSPMQAAIEKIRIGRKEDAHIAALLDNMGRPDAILIPKGDSEGGGIGTDEARRMRSIMKQEFRMAGRGGLAVSEFPGSIEVLGWKPQDVVEIERAKAIKTDICNSFGVPDALLERNSANLASAKTADYAHAKYAINPRCCRLAEVLNDRLVRLFDPSGRTFLVYDNPIADDEVFELEITKTGGQLGVASVDETRASLGLELLGGPAGNMRYVATTLAPIGPDGMPILPPPPAAPLVAPKAIEDSSAKIMANAVKLMSDAMVRLAEASAKPDNSGAELIGLVRELIQREKSQAPVFISTPTNSVCTFVYQPKAIEENATAITTVDAKIVPFDGNRLGNRDPHTGLAGPLPQGDALAHILRLFFQRQRIAALDALDSHGKAIDAIEMKIDKNKDRFQWEDFAGGIPSRFTPLEPWNEELAKDAQPIIEMLMKTGAEALTTRLGADPEVLRVVNANIPEAARNLTLKFSDSTNATTTQQLETALEKLRGELAEGLEAGDTRVMLRKRVEEVFDQADSSRAETIARTEASRATHAGETKAAKESGVVKAKSWLASADACPICLGYAAEGDVDLDHVYDDDADYPVDGPPGHPRCQCSQTFLLKSNEEIEAFATGTGEADPAAATA